MVHDLKERIGTSPLLTILLVALVPFPILALMLLMDRWMKSDRRGVTSEVRSRL